MTHNMCVCVGGGGVRLCMRRLKAGLGNLDPFKKSSEGQNKHVLFYVHQMLQWATGCPPSSDKEDAKLQNTHTHTHTQLVFGWSVRVLIK